MSRLSLTDPAYTKAYFKALTLDPLMAWVVEKLRRNDTFTTNQQPQTLSTNEPTPTDTPQWNITTNTQPLRTTPPFNCYRCGSHAHALRDCGPLIELVNKGLLSRDSNYKVCLPNGQLICWQQGEMLLDAYHWISTNRQAEQVSAHLMTYNLNYYKRGSTNYIVVCMSDREYDKEEDDDLSEDYNTTNEDEDAGMSYGVERAPRANWDARRQVMDGIYMPPPQGMIGKWNEVAMDAPCTYDLDSWWHDNGATRNPRASENRPNERSEWTPAPQGRRGPSHKQIQSVQNDNVGKDYSLTEANTRAQQAGVCTTHTLAAKDEDIVVSEPCTWEGGGRNERGEVTRTQDYNSKSRVSNENQTPKTVAWCLDIANSVAPQAVLNKLLSMEICVTACEMISASPSVSKVLSELIWLKNVTLAIATSQSHHMSRCRHHSTLLEVPATIGNTTYTAVVDSGSEVWRDIWSNDIKVPMDPDASMSLCDANRGNNWLLGLIPDLEIKIGGLSTSGDVWVSNEILPAVLLRRPWQQQNMVSIDEWQDRTYLQFSHVNGRDNWTMEILLQPYESKNGRSHLISGYVRNHATTLSVFLGEVVELITNQLPNPDGHTLSHTHKDIQERSQSTYKLSIEVVYEPRGTIGTACTLGETYQRIFQPDPSIEYHGIPSEQFDNSQLGPIASSIHAPSGNFQANYLALNSAQYDILQSHVRGVDSHFCLTYILPTQLPHVTAEADKRWIILPMVELPNDTHTITSPVPFTLFTWFGQYSCPFLPAYSNHLDTTLRNADPTAPPEPIYADASLPSPLTLLADACGICHQITHIRDEESASKSDFPHKTPLEWELEIALRSLPTPLNKRSHFFGPTPSSGHPVDCKGYATNPSPLSDSINSTTMEELDLFESCSEASSDSGWDSDCSNYPPPHSNPTMYAAAIGRRNPYNLPFTLDSNPTQVQQYSNPCLRPLLFAEGYFDGTNCYNTTGNYHTTHFQPSQEYNSD